MMKTFVALFASLLLSCAHTAITPFSVPPKGGYAPNPPSSVSIYRSERPTFQFKEIGLISYQSPNLNLSEIYEVIRNDAANYGADAVIDVKLRGDRHYENRWITECTPVTRCSPDGGCTTENVCQDHYIVVDVTNFLIEGSMIRRQP